MLINVVLLIVGTLTRRRKMLLPWMLTDLVAILLMFTIFLASIFVSYFIDILVSIVFPVVAGIVMQSLYKSNRMLVCLSVPKYLDDNYTDMVHLYS